MVATVREEEEEEVEVAGRRDEASQASLAQIPYSSLAPLGALYLTISGDPANPLPPYSTRELDPSIFYSPCRQA